MPTKQVYKVVKLEQHKHAVMYNKLHTYTASGKNVYFDTYEQAKEYAILNNPKCCAFYSLTKLPTDIIIVATEIEENS